MCTYLSGYLYLERVCDKSRWTGYLPRYARMDENKWAFGLTQEARLPGNGMDPPPITWAI